MQLGLCIVKARDSGCCGRFSIGYNNLSTPVKIDFLPFLILSIGLAVGCQSQEKLCILGASHRAAWVCIRLPERITQAH